MGERGPATKALVASHSWVEPPASWGAGGKESACCAFHCCTRTVAQSNIAPAQQCRSQTATQPVLTIPSYPTSAIMSTPAHPEQCSTQQPPGRHQPPHPTSAIFLTVLTPTPPAAVYCSRMRLILITAAAEGEKRAGWGMGVRGGQEWERQTAGREAGRPAGRQAGRQAASQTGQWGTGGVASIWEANWLWRPAPKSSAGRSAHCGRHTEMQTA